jgi:hypothetical protein
MAKRKALLLTPAGGSAATRVTVYADETKLAQFVSQIVYASDQNLPNQTAEVEAHTRRRYPGGPAINVAAHSRIYDPNRGYNQSVLPGMPFWLERTDALGDKTVRQFTYVGKLTNLKDAIRDHRIGEVTLRGPSGDAWDFGSET